MIKIVNDVLFFFGFGNSAEYERHFMEKGTFYKVEELYYNPTIKGWIVEYETEKPYKKPLPKVGNESRER